MGYFDYLDQKSAVELKDEAFIETYSKIALWINIATVVLSIIAIMLFCFIPIGSVVWLDIVLALGMGAGVVAMVYASKVRQIAKRRHKTNLLANFILVWSLFFVLLNAIMCVMNTWVYFA